ncbi:MAG TPA: XRE family transcriptional regulator [Streptosporangiaceae bacterium]|nr:XRE family transcriptional regulator [Streptosporangiaceae bacterium]
MPKSANDLIDIPATLWQRPAMIDALRRRDIGRVFELVGQYTGASQTRIGIATVFSQPKVSAIIHGVQHVEELAVFERIADGLKMPDSARMALGLAPIELTDSQSSALIPSRDDASPTSAPSQLAARTVLPDGQEEPVQRRTFVTLTGASLFGAVLAGTDRSGPTAATEAFAGALAAYASDSNGSKTDATPDLAALGRAVAMAKRDYQACRYTDVIDYMPRLLTGIRIANGRLSGDRLCRAAALSADAHHVAASILLKLGDQGLAWLAADRSLQAANASGDPLTIASSARIITHALTSSGYRNAAATTASSHAKQLNHDTSAHDPEFHSVYGALLLRGAIAAAQDNDRSTAHELLDEADAAGQRLGTDANLRWTAFGPVNVSLHRVYIAVTLGDAGTAIDTARRINLDQVTVTERKASFLIDTARAFLQCGKHENSYLTLRAAHDIAPEEITGRPAVRQLARDLITTAPPTVQRQAAEFATQLGIAR